MFNQVEFHRRYVILISSFFDISAFPPHGKSQQYTFALNDPTFGVSISLSVLQNNMNVTWSLGGSTLTPGVPTSTSLSPTSFPGRAELRVWREGGTV